MTDAAVVGRLLAEYHERTIAPSAVRLAAGSVHETQVSYHVMVPGRPPQLIRAYRADAPVPSRDGSALAEPVADWLEGRAATLARLEQAGFPAPRPVRTRTGELVGVAGPWLSWATTFIDGTPIAPTPEQLELVGAALGQLHRLPAARPARRPGSAAAGPGLAARHPAVAVPVTLARLDAVSAAVPDGWRSMYDTFRWAAETVRERAVLVPEALVHDDVWAGNVVTSGPGAVTLTGWESGGLGLAVLDLGNSLIECNLDASLPEHEPDPRLISPDPDRIGALARGYAGARRLTGAERALLPAAVSFPAAVAGAVHLECALLHCVAGPAMDARLARLRNRIEVAEAVVALALPFLEP